MNQLHRSPGIFFDKTTARAATGGRGAHSSRIIPARGSWLDMDFDAKNILYLRIDRRKEDARDHPHEGHGVSTRTSWPSTTPRSAAPSRATWSTSTSTSRTWSGSRWTST